MILERAHSYAITMSEITLCCVLKPQSIRVLSYKICVISVAFCAYMRDARIRPLLAHKLKAAKGTVEQIEYRLVL